MIDWAVEIFGEEGRLLHTYFLGRDLSVPGRGEAETPAVVSFDRGRASF